MIKVRKGFTKGELCAEPRKLNEIWGGKKNTNRHFRNGVEILVSCLIFRGKKREDTMIGTKFLV